MKSINMKSINFNEVVSPIKFKIIEYLYDNQYATLATLIQHCRTSYVNIMKHIETLKKMNVLREHRINKIRVFSLNYDNSYTKIYLAFIFDLRRILNQETYFV
mgnify:FL=1